MDFIHLYFHLHLALVTNYLPIGMLLILVGIAALLIPVHHQLEYWIINFLVEKNKQIWLATAKKIISQLEN